MGYNKWYFKDWETVDQLTESGKTKHIYTYKGSYYLLPEPVSKFKIFCIVIMLVYIAMFIFLAFFPCTSSYDNQVGALCLLQIIPALFFCMTIRPLIKAKPQMTYRRYHRIFYRMRWGAGVAAAVSLVQTVFDIRLIIIDSTTDYRDIIYLIVLILELIMIAIFAVYILKLKFEIADPDPEYENPSDE